MILQIPIPSLYIAAVAIEAMTLAATCIALTGESDAPEIMRRDALKVFAVGTVLAVACIVAHLAGF